MVAAAGGLDRPRPGGDEQRVVEELGSAPRRRGAEVGVHGGEVVDDEERTACVREPGEVEAVHAATAERLDDGERPVPEPRLRRDEIDRDPFLGQPAQRERGLEGGHSAAGRSQPGIDS